VNRPRLRTVSRKLLAVVLLTTLIALIVGLGASVYYNLRIDQRNFVYDMNTQSELLGHMTAPALSFDDKQLASQNLNMLSIRPSVRAAAIYNAQGELFASYLAPGETASFPKAIRGDSLESQGRDLVLLKPIVNDGAMIGTIYLRANYALLDKVVGSLEIASVVTVLAMLIAIFFSLPLQRSVSGPILDIAGIAREVMEKRDYSRRARKISDDEVGTLVESFNNMLAEIERSTRELENSNREIAHESSQRSRAQQEVMRLNTELELRVMERTAELEVTNKDLARAKVLAEQANQAKSVFLSNMSHELRTPLNAILGFAQLSATESLPVTAEQRKEFIEHIINAGKHLLVLINEILDLAKVESGTLTLSLEPVSTMEVLQECQTMIERSAEARAIRLSLPIGADISVQADRTRLKQVLLNLMSNAVKYNREGGAVIVSCVEDANKRVRIAVQDTGPGLDEHQLQQLFQPFNRLGRESGNEEGSGIGLVVSKRLVERMGGEIGVTSSAGWGSVFWIELNTAAPPMFANGAGEGRIAAHAAATKDSRHATLLYVEDNRANLKLVQEIVRFHGNLHMLSATDAKEGIELARRNRPDVILMDINLPGMSGIEALQILGKDALTAHIPVIALTANAMLKDVQAGMEIGFFRYLTKPINIEEFFSALDAALNGVPAEIQTDQDNVGAKP
jgi:signal transduction histidine kinase/ActR/RegA family two-component response regulator